MGRMLRPVQVVQQITDSTKYEIQKQKNKIHKNIWPSFWTPLHVTRIPNSYKIDINKNILAALYTIWLWPSLPFTATNILHCILSSSFRISLFFLPSFFSLSLSCHNISRYYSSMYECVSECLCVYCAIVCMRMDECVVTRNTSLSLHNTNITHNSANTYR